MKQIITAIGDPKLNEEIRKEGGCNVVAADIQYQEGVIELLEENSSIDVLILSSIIPGENDIYKLINKIKEINQELEIIIILEKQNEEIKNFLISRGIFNIFYNNQITTNELINLLKKDENKIPENINEEIKMLKEMILQNNNKINNKNKIINKLIINIFKIIKNSSKKIIKIINKLFNKNKIINNKINKNKIISIIGNNNSGKTLFCGILGRIAKNKKILIIDFDFINNNISTIFGVNKLPKKINKENKNELKINDLIIKINNKLNLICGLEILFNLKEKINKNKIKEIINDVSNKYDLIIIDTCSAELPEYTEEIIKNSDQSIFLLEPNLLEIKKTKKLLEKYIHKWNIKNDKINILFNKYNIYSINYLILKKLFYDFNILGKIKLNKKYNLIINKKINNINRKIKKEYSQIINKIFINTSQ